MHKSVKINFVLFLIFPVLEYAQKIENYTCLDSVKHIQNSVIYNLHQQHLPLKVIDSISDHYKDIRDSLRERAHDFTDSIMEHMERWSHLELCLDLISNQYYYGRRGPAAGTVGSPSAGYLNKTGLYTTFTADLYELSIQQIQAPKRGSRTDTVPKSIFEPDLTLTAGWTYTFFNKWDLGIYYDHSFIFYGTDKKLLSNTLDLNSNFDFWGYLNAGFDYQFLFGGAASDPLNKKTASVFLFNVSEEFRLYRLPDAAILSFEPEVSSYVGNDNLARSRQIAKGRHGGENVPELYDNFFGLLDLEAAICLKYRIKNLELQFAPHIALPFNEIPDRLPPNITQASQLAQYRQNQYSPPVFYASFGLKYLFKFWKEKSRSRK